MPNWTKEQTQAIYKNNSNILVAAAAGSGKTAVLVERMINKIINEKIDIDKILIVTFTNAAASEMRERILNAIYEKLDENPEDENLQRQLTLLNLANICTIDSFCLEIVKNNFYELDNISPNFRIADTTEIDIIKEEVLEEIFEEKYETEDEDFTTLINTYTSYRDDTPLKELIKKIYQYISSNPFPKQWLHEKIEMFNLKDKNLINKDFKETIWGEELLNEINEELQDDLIILEDLKQMLSQDQELEPCFQIIKNDIDQIQNLKNNLNSWDSAYQISQNLKFTEWTRKKVKPEIKDEAKKIRDLVKEKLNKKREKILITDSKQATQDIYNMYSTLSKLEKLILEFDQKFSNKKREKNIVDFTDIEHFALQILVKNENGKITKTEIAKKYTEKFEEIAIDEYQDSNKVQEYILTSISKGNNIFMVGDVKQSIYKFRQAMPELFIEKYKTYTQTEESTSGTKIQLFKNFRSRSNVLDFTNLIFENIMSEKLGDVEYTQEEYLNLGATDYEQNQQNLQTQITIINTNQEEKYIPEDQEDEETQIEEEHLEDIELEAKYISNEIKNLIDSKYQIYDRKNKKFRNIQPKDIVILLRSTKDKASIYEQELTKNNLPVFSDSTQEYLETVEIQTIISLLKLIDNPLQDIPLITVLRSPIGGFTDDDLVQIRITDKNETYFYECMQKAKINVDETLKSKIQMIEQNIEQWRIEQEYLALDELIWKIYIDTGYYNYVGLMPNGAQRQANLKILFERAKQYETSSFKGLYNFINFIERLKSTNSDLGPAKIVGENDNVIRIMSIHKSKGLEFPIIFLANTNKQFNKQDIKNDKVLLHQKYGLGPQYIDYNMQIKYDTLARLTVKNKIEIENLSEEMRILYVALTRAKEKIYITATQKNMQQKIDNIQKQVDIYKKENGKINPILLKKCNSYLDWILLVNEYNKKQIEKMGEVKIIEKEKLLKKLKQQEEKPEQIDLEEKLKIKNYISQKELAEKIKEEIEYEYPYKETTKLPTKMSVSEIKQIKSKDIHESEYNLKEPQFIALDETKPLTGAQKGTIMHLCMQKLDTNKDYTLEQLKQFIQELYENNIISQKEKQSIQLNKLYNYTKTPIWQELKTAKLIQREKPFYIELPAKEIYNQDIEGEILVQGIIDLYYINQKDELILLDYKTDYTQSEQELIDKYKTQLEIYKKALEKSLNKKVDKTYIYSLYLQKICDII